MRGILKKIVVGAALFVLLIVAAAAVYVMLIGSGPTVQQTEETKWLVDMPIAHRGLHSEAIPENSMAAFQQAIEAGYAIELDVQITSDGEVVVIHDYDLLRVAGVDALVAEQSWSDIQALPLNGTSETIPRLTDVLELVDGSVPLLIELKNEGEVGLLEQAVIDVLAGYDGLYAIQAFNPFVLNYFKKHAPHMIRGQLSSHFKDEDLAFYEKFLLRYLVLNNLSEPSFIAYEKDSMPDWLAKLQRRKNAYLIAWTVLSAEDQQLKLGQFDNVIFEGYQP